jgi:hypothetical protein
MMSQITPVGIGTNTPQSDLPPENDDAPKSVAITA